MGKVRVIKDDAFVKRESLFRIMEQIKQVQSKGYEFKDGRLRFGVSYDGYAVNFYVKRKGFLGMTEASGRIYGDNQPVQMFINNYACVDDVKGFLKHISKITGVDFDIVITKNTINYMGDKYVGKKVITIKIGCKK